MVKPSSAGLKGWRFSPKDEELINYFLAPKINGKDDDNVNQIREIDVCKWEPWDLPSQSKLKTADKEWFFFCPQDQKFPSSSRFNRATHKGFWKSTGLDRKIMSKKKEIGFKKTLVFHTGRAPKGQRTCWVIHEYCTTLKELDGTRPGQRPFVLCRLFNKDDDFVPDATENDHPTDADINKSLQSEMQPQTDAFDNRKPFADPNPNDNSLFDSPMPESMGSSLPVHSANNNSFGNEDLHDDYIHIDDVLQSLLSNSPDNSFQDQGNNQISVDREAYLSEMVAELEREINDPSQASMGSSLPVHSATDYSFGNEDLQLDSEIYKDDDYTYDVVHQSLDSNSPDNSFQAQGNCQISVDYEIPKENNIPSMDSGPSWKSDREEAELREMVAELEREINDPSQASMGSSLPDHLATNYFFGNEDLQLDCEIYKDDDYTYDDVVHQSLDSNSPDNSFQAQGNSLISVVYEIPKANNIPSMDSGSFWKSDREEAELSEMVAELERYAFNAESNDPSQESNFQIIASGWASDQELDKSQTHPRGRSFTACSVVKHCADDQVSSSHTNLSKPDHVADSGVQIRHRQTQVAPATDNNDKHGTAQRRIHLQTNRSRYELQCDDSGQQDLSRVFQGQSPKLKEDNQKVYKKFISSVIYSFQPSISYKLIIGLASIVTIIAAYAVIRGCLGGR